MKFSDADYARAANFYHDSPDGQYDHMAAHALTVMPDLLAALKTIVSDWEHVEAHLDTAREAITKAEG